MSKTLYTSKENISNQEYIISLVKKGIWLYFLLIIFEGALRKWFLPFLSTPLLVVRDPIALVIIYLAWKHNLVKANVYVLVMIALTFIAIITSLIFGHGSLFVAIYGARIFLLHFPLMFIIGNLLDQEDVIKIGKVLLLISIPMAIIIALQFYSPQSAWINRGVGGDVEGAGFSGALGYYRPPGTFSFTTGNVIFFSLVACYLFYFFVEKIEISKVLLLGATASLLAALPLSISRTLIFSVGITLVFTLFTTLNKPKYFARMLMFTILGVLVIFVLAQTSFFETSIGVMTQRFENASNSEGSIGDSIVDRFLSGMLTAVSDSNQLPFFGFGIGMGTNAGAALLTGQRTFLIAEGEWLRLVGEMGFIVGVLVILLRVIFSIDIFSRSYKAMLKGNILPWLLLSFGFLQVLRGQWAQPTVLGFSTLIGGLILACTTNTKNVNN